jgi:hypothetical protein
VVHGAHRGKGPRIDSLAHPPMRPEEFQEPRWARFLFASTTDAWLWLIVRLYTASVFIPAGWEKVTSGKWRFGDGAPIQGLIGGAISADGWIGLDRWFMPWIHRNVFTKPPGAEGPSTA